MIAFEKFASGRRGKALLLCCCLGMVAVVATGCGGGGDSRPTPSPSPSINPSPSPIVEVSPSPSPSVEPSPSPSPSATPPPDYNVSLNQGRFLFSEANSANANLEEMFLSYSRPIADLNSYGYGSVGNVGNTCLFGYNGYANSSIGLALWDSNRFRIVTVEIKYRDSPVFPQSPYSLPQDAPVMDGYPTGSQFATAQVYYSEGDGNTGRSWKAVSGNARITKLSGFFIRVRLENVRLEPAIQNSAAPLTNQATGSFLLNGEEEAHVDLRI